MRYLTEQDIDNIAIGAAVLGTGGGGDPYIGKLMAKQAIAKYGPVQLISLDELDDNALVVPVSGIGAPTVLLEKIPSEQELMAPLEKLEEVMGKKVDVVMPIEIGGVNSLIPVAVAAKKGLPILDADAMGRAFPEAQMVSFHLKGFEPSPVTMSDSKGNCAVFFPVDAKSYEGIARAITVAMGASATMCDYPLLGKEVKTAVIENTLTLAQQIGEMILNGTNDASNTIDKLLKKLDGYKLFSGKLIDIERKVEGGFTRGIATFHGLSDDNKYTISFQNEYLMAKCHEQYLCMTPDLIALLDLESGLPITTEKLRYGSRVIAVAFNADPIWHTDIGIKTAGPRYFGYETDYVNLPELQNKSGGNNV